MTPKAHSSGGKEKLSVISKQGDGYIRRLLVVGATSVNRSALRPVLRQFVLPCRQLGLFGRELLAVDGARIKAVNNKDRNFTRASLAHFIKLADAKLDDYLQRLDQDDLAGNGTAGSRAKNLAEKIAAIRTRRTRCQDMLAKLGRTGEGQISLADPDSRAMAAHTRAAVGYNVQVAVDAKHKLIVERQVTNEAVLDRMQARLAKRPDILDRRRETAERPFGTIQRWMNQKAFLMRGLGKARAEFSLTALAGNLRRVPNVVGFAELMAAVAA